MHGAVTGTRKLCIVAASVRERFSWNDFHVRFETPRRNRGGTEPCRLIQHHYE